MKDLLGQPTAFTLHYNLQDKDILKAFVITPSGRQEEAVVENIDIGQYVVRFMPNESGPHIIYVCSISKTLWTSSFMLNENTANAYLIPGSPFRLMVSPQTCDPSKVYADGKGLLTGTVGSRNEFFVNTVNAGSGTLNVTIDGPSKVRLTCTEDESGYEFFYFATSPGQYTITIKYGGNYHITGSPYIATITGTPIDDFPADENAQQSHVLLETVGKSMNARNINQYSTRQQYQHSYKSGRDTGDTISEQLYSNADVVECSGIGLRKAYLDQINKFTVDASNAGYDTLLVGVTGPSHRPCEEVVVKHIHNNQYSVNYRVETSGRHMLIVKWGEKHVPGSPFVIDVP